MNCQIFVLKIKILSQLAFYSNFTNHQILAD